MALTRRAPREGGIIHSDQGVQFASWVFSQKVTEAGLAPSVGAVGAPFDNAMVEAFWARMQVELLNRRRWKTRLELATAIHDYIETWHNTKRRHSALNMLTPSEIREQPPPPKSTTRDRRLIPEPQLQENQARSLLRPLRRRPTRRQRSTRLHRPRDLRQPRPRPLDHHLCQHRPRLDRRGRHRPRHRRIRRPTNPHRHRPPGGAQNPSPTSATARATSRAIHRPLRLGADTTKARSAFTPSLWWGADDEQVQPQPVTCPTLSAITCI